MLKKELKRSLNVVVLRKLRSAKEFKVNPCCLTLLLLRTLCRKLVFLGRPKASRDLRSTYIAGAYCFLTFGVRLVPNFKAMENHS